MFKETNSKYKNRIKSRVMNLRDKRNTALKTMIIEGEITPERFAKMTADVNTFSQYHYIYIFLSFCYTFETRIFFKSSCLHTLQKLIFTSTYLRWL